MRPARIFLVFEEAAILTVDGVGEWPTTTQLGKRRRDQRLGSVEFPDSLYSAVTGYLGFEVNEGEYKVMGLRPMGDQHTSSKYAR
jgi:carbamoyltransferase